MDVNYKGGQEMMNLNYMNDAEVKKMAGNPAQAGGRFDSKTVANSSVEDHHLQTSSLPKRKNTTKENTSDSCFQRFVISIDNSIKSFWDVLILLLIAYSCFTTTY